MVELFRTFRQLGENFMFGAQTKQPLEVMASNTLREAVKYGTPFDKKHISELAKDSAYRIAVPYFAIKYLDGYPDIQRDMLSQIITNYRSNPSADTISTTAIMYLQGLPGDIGTDVKPDKLSRLQLWTPSLVHQQAEHVIADAIAKEETPALIAYSGLFALEEALKHVDEVRHLYILFPKYDNQSLGFKVAIEENTVKVESTTAEDINREEIIALIDDAIYSGKTAEDIQRRFTHTQFDNKALFTINK